MDKTYKERLALRRSLLEKYHDTVVAVNNDSDKRVRAAVCELYTFLMGTYLPGRYPTMFKLHRAEYETGNVAMLHNLVTGEIWPVELSPEAPTIRALETLVKVVDEDILILLPEQEKKEKEKQGEVKEEAGTKYILKAYAACFPAGFDTRKKLGQRLAKIHEPVPGYQEKLEKSMDRFFEKLEVGKYVKRVNWSITTDAELFSAFGNVHGGEGEKLEAIKPEELNLDKVRAALPCFSLIALLSSVQSLDETQLLNATHTRPSSAVNVKPSTVSLPPRPSCSRSTRTRIQSGRSRKKGWGRN